MSETELIAAAKAGDQDAFAELYKQHVLQVKAIGLKFLKNDHDAEDLCQTVFTVAFAKLHAFRGNSLGAWLGTIAQNECRAIFTRRAQQKNGTDHLDSLSELSEPDSSGLTWEPRDESAERSFAAIDARLTLARIMSGVSPESRELVEMFYGYDMTESEIVRDTGLPLGVIRGRIWRTMQNLQKKVRQPKEMRPNPL